MADPLLFVSHVSEDRAAAMELVGELERRGVACWIAPRDVRPGEPFDDEIAAAIERTRAMLLVFSDRCNDSVYIRREITVAGEAHKLVIPLRIEDAQPRRGLKIRLADLHWIDAFAAREQAIDMIVRSLRSSGEVSETAEVFAVPRPESGVTVAVDIDDLISRAEAGDAEAENDLGAEYLGGGSVAQDDRAAFKWFRKAAEQGHAPGQCNLGFMYENGRGVAADHRAAAAWYRKAAEQGLAEAEYNLGVCFEHGRGVDGDIRQALAWYRKAAEHGDASAQYNLGVLFEAGRGTKRDERAAVVWYRKSAEQGDAEAQNNLGTMYVEGQGVSRDDREAFAWFRRAADQGLAAAEYNLGFMFENGRAAARDLGKAVEWYRKAARQHYALASEALKRLGVTPFGKPGA